MTTDATIHVQSLEKSVKELKVLRGVDFDASPGNLSPAGRWMASLTWGGSHAKG